MTTADLWVGTAPNLPALIGAALAPMLFCLMLAVGLAATLAKVVGMATVKSAWDMLVLDINYKINLDHGL